MALSDSTFEESDGVHLDSSDSWYFVSRLLHQASFPLVPALLFGAFLASGGQSFPRIFFRTFFRDLKYGTSLINTLSLPLYLLNKGQHIANIEISYGFLDFV